MDIRRRFLGIHEEGTATESNIIYYTTKNNSTITPYKTTGYGANYIGSSYNDGVGTLVFDGPITRIPAYAFYQCSFLSSIVFPNTITSIEEWALRDCAYLKTVTLPNRITVLHTGLFFGCDNSLNSIEIPESVIEIGNNVFRECLALRTLTIPQNVTRIGNYLIFISGVNSIYFRSVTPPALSSDTLKLSTTHNQTMPTLYVPNTALDAYKSATVWSNYTSYIRGYNA